jgi:predicted deacylase
VTDSPVSCSIDLAAPGKQIGHLAFPKITNTAGWASTFVHVGSVANGEGPTVLVLAGNHGDEYEGQVAALRLLQELQPERVSGRVVVIPALSPAASNANTRNWPSGANFNRSFPGRPDGPPNEQLAHFLSTVLFPLADVVIDMHSGGRSAWFLPCSHMHVVDDPAQRRSMLEGMEAWCSDWHYLYIEVQTRASLGLPPAVILDGRDPANIVVSPEDGLFEALLEPGDPVSAGEPVGRLWFIDRPDRPPEEILAPLDGYLAVTKAIPVTEQGDNVFVLGQPIDRSALL